MAEKSRIRVVICGNCEKEFETLDRKKKYCCTKCQKKANSNKRKIRPKDKEAKQITCLTCGVTFETTDGRRRYCSKKCYNVANKEKQNEYQKELFKSIRIKQETVPKKRGRKKKRSAIAEIAYLARKEGKTYGQYVAEQECIARKRREKAIYGEKKRDDQKE